MASEPDLSRVEWHIVDDSTLVESSTDPDSGQSKYCRYTTSRRVTEAEVLDHARRFQGVLRPGEVAATPSFVLFALGLVGVFVGWLVLGPVGVEEQVAAVVFWGSLALALVGLVVILAFGFARRKGLERLQRDSAWDMFEGQGLKHRQARELIATPGTVTVRQQTAR